MKVTQLVDLGSQEVEISIGTEDIVVALRESFAAGLRDQDTHPNQRDILTALNDIACFLKALKLNTSRH
jgi:hypothetical protein